MSRRRSIEKRRHSLREIADIMNSMRTLAYMETRKLSKFVSAQQAVVKNLESVAQDLLYHYPDLLPRSGQRDTLILLMGSERGFCGNFNHAVINEIEHIPSGEYHQTYKLITVGDKLHTLLENDARLAVSIQGANVSEEITLVLDRLAEEISTLQREQLVRVVCLYHDTMDGVAVQQLLPPFQQLDISTTAHRYPPVLNLTPAAFFSELMDHYLFAVLHAMLFTSLMMENRHRLNHLQRAVNHLDKQVEELERRSNMLRQEEIIEEIEVILLDISNLGASRPIQHK